MPQSTESLKKWIGFLKATYPSTELTDDNIRAYYQWLRDVPERDFQWVFESGMKTSGNFPPTGSTLKDLWEKRQNKSDDLAAEQEWELCCNHVRDYGEQTFQSDRPLWLSNAGEKAFREIGWRLGLVRVLDCDAKGMEFAHKRFVAAYKLHVETGGLLAPTREEARKMLDKIRDLAKGLPKASDETA